MGTIALTGWSGLIGSAVLRALSGKHDIRTIGRSQNSDLVADLSQPTTISALDLGGCDAVVHCAGIVDEDFSDPERAFRRATQGMAALVARASSYKLSHFIYISSAHVYGALVGKISENTPPNPLSDYAIAHYASEQILRRATGAGLCAAVLRPCAVFGIPPDVTNFRRWSLIPFAFPKSLIDKSRIELKSAGTQRRNFVGAEDVARAAAIWLNDASSNPFEIINPIGKADMSVFAFARTCAEIAEQVTGKSATILRPDSPDCTVDLFDYTTRDTRFIGSADLGATIQNLLHLLMENRGEVIRKR